MDKIKLLAEIEAMQTEVREIDRLLARACTRRNKLAYRLAQLKRKIKTDKI